MESTSLSRSTVTPNPINPPFDNLGILERFRVAKDSKAYGIIGAILAAIGSFSEENKKRILDALSRNPASVIDGFEKPLKQFKMDACGTISGQMLHFAGEQMVASCVDEIDAATGHELSTSEKDTLEARVKESLADVIENEEDKYFQEVIQELENEFSKLGEGIPESPTKENLNTYNRLYSKLFRTFFTEYPENKNVNAEHSIILSRTSLRTPARANIIHYDSGRDQFVADNGDYAAFAKMATEILHRRDAIADHLGYQHLDRK
jgi:uncharacterized protein YaaR (DUF327 family)